MRLDHLAIAAETLDEGIAWAQARLGVTFGAGGTHPRYGTHNRLLGLKDGLYLEVIAKDPGAACEDACWFGLDAFSGPARLVNWICEPDDFESVLVHGMRAVAMQRGDLRWDMGVPEDGRLPMGGAFPTVLRWITPNPPGRSLAPSGVALQKLTVRHPDAARIEAEIGQVLNDDRVRFEPHGDIALSAQFETPRGVVVI